MKILDGWDLTIPSAGKPPGLAWTIKRVHASGYIRENEKIYLTTIKRIIAQAAPPVSTMQIYLALRDAGCPVYMDMEYFVFESDLAKTFSRIENTC